MNSIEIKKYVGRLIWEVSMILEELTVTSNASLLNNKSQLKSVANILNWLSSILVDDWDVSIGGYHFIYQQIETTDNTFLLNTLNWNAFCLEVATQVELPANYGDKKQYECCEFSIFDWQALGADYAFYKPASGFIRVFKPNCFEFVFDK